MRKTDDKRCFDARSNFGRDRVHGREYLHRQRASLVVYAVARKSGVKIPSFFGYLAGQWRFYCQYSRADTLIRRSQTEPVVRFSSLRRSDRGCASFTPSAPLVGLSR
jgi:hypothetical protein